MTDNVRKTSPVLIAIAWLVVAVPTGWGVTQSAKQAWKLFSSPTPARPASTAPASTR